MNRENRKVVSSRHDYVLCYAKAIVDEKRVLKQLPMSGEALDRYSNPDNDPRGPWKSDPATAQAGHATKAQFYVLVTPSGKKHKLPAGRCWLYTEPVMMKAIEEGRIWLGPDGNNTPRKKTYLYEKDRGLTPETIWFGNEVSTNEMAKNELKTIFPETIPFTTPKPPSLIERIMTLCMDDTDIILDSFAGSGTTAHAVLNMNKADGGSRKFILVEMMDYAESITAERVKRVIDGYGSGKQAVEGTGGDFTFYDLGPVLLLPDGNLNEEVGAAKIREYVYFMETRTAIQKENPDEPYFMGVHVDSAYYFYYEKERLTTLNREFLHGIKTKADRYTIYADLCTLSEAELERWHITFKKIPRDISKL